MSKQRAAALKAQATVRSLHPDFHGPILSALADHGVVEPNDGGEIRAAASGSRLDKIQAEDRHARKSSRKTRDE
jgi:hypothetical protein